MCQYAQTAQSKTTGQTVPKTTGQTVPYTGFLTPGI